MVSEIHSHSVVRIDQNLTVITKLYKMFTHWMAINQAANLLKKWYMYNIITALFLRDSERQTQRDSEVLVSINKETRT